MDAMGVAIRAFGPPQPPNQGPGNGHKIAIGGLGSQVFLLVQVLGIQDSGFAHVKFWARD